MKLLLELYIIKKIIYRILCIIVLVILIMYVLPWIVYKLLFIIPLEPKKNYEDRHPALQVEDYFNKNHKKIEFFDNINKEN